MSNNPVYGDPLKPKTPESNKPDPWLEEIKLKTALNTQPICESFEWFAEARDLILDDKTPGSVRVKVVWGHANELSLNKREYVEPELAQFARTMINRAINDNHLDAKKIGRLPWSEWNFKEHQGEAIAEITKEPYVTQLKNGSLKPRWSIQANYLRCECSRCHKSFNSEQALNEHIRNDEAGLNAVNVPRGMIAGDPCALALVTGNEQPGLNTSGEVLVETAETAKKGFTQLCETFIQERGLTQTLEAKPKELTEKTQPDKLTEAVNVLQTAASPIRTAFNTVLDIMDKNVLEWRSKYEAEIKGNGSTQKLSETTKERDTLRETVKTQTSNLTELQSKLKEVAEERSALKGTVQIQTNTIAELQDKITEQSNKVTALETEKTKLQQEVTRRDDLVETNKKLKIENENLSDKLTYAAKFKGHTPCTAKPNNQPIIDDPLKRK